MKKLISLIFIALLTVVGCSTITPAPELIITNVTPPGGGGGALTIYFRSTNYVDAILTKRTTTFTDTIGTAAVVESYNIAGYIPGGAGNDSASSYSYTFTPSYPAMGAGASVQVTFTGTDAYGYNKVFTVTTPKIWY
jgi:hypothetical protein